MCRAAFSGLARRSARRANTITRTSTLMSACCRAALRCWQRARCNSCVKRLVEVIDMRFLPTLALLTLTGCMGKTAAPVGQTEGPVRQPETMRAMAVQAEHGMVASDNGIASDVGVRVLQSGGNAVDAAVATAFALAVAYPEAGNLGGGGFMVARLADGSRVALDFREKAPLRATHDMYLDAQGNVTTKSLIGHLASGVPGSVAGLYVAHQRFGSKPWKELIAPAIELAETGVPVDQHFADVVAAHEERLRQFAGSAALFLPGGKPLQAGTT